MHLAVNLIFNFTFFYNQFYVLCHQRNDGGWQKLNLGVFKARMCMWMTMMVMMTACDSV